jgi:hypothetical protein
MTDKPIRVGRVIWHGWLPAADPMYNSGWNYIAGKQLNPRSSRPSTSTSLASPDEKSAPSEPARAASTYAPWSEDPDPPEPEPTLAELNRMAKGAKELLRLSRLGLTEAQQIRKRRFQLRVFPRDGRECLPAQIITPKDPCQPEWIVCRIRQRRRTNH